MSYKNQLDKVVDDITLQIAELSGAMKVDDPVAQRLMDLTRIATLNKIRWDLVKRLIEENGKYDG